MSARRFKRRRDKFLDIKRPEAAKDPAYGSFIYALEKTAETGRALETREIPGTYYDTMVRRGFRLRRCATDTGYAYWCEPLQTTPDWRGRSRAGLVS
jgi:hypothetical protein